jgi:lysine-N-methylase
VIPLSEADLKRLENQHWETHSDFVGTQTVVRSWFGKRSQLARRADGSCVFLSDDNRCRIHAEHGAAAKPLVCQMYPLQLVPHDKQVVLTLRRSCPSAAADEGSPLTEHLRSVRRLAKQGGLLEQAVRAPAITRNYRGSWSEALMVASSIERLLTDERYPLVRRLVHGVRFCTLLEQCNLKRLEKGNLGELLEILEESSREDVGDLFRDRRMPRRAIAILFRQTAAEYLRLHSHYRATNSWRERWRLTRAAVSIARGRGTAPQFHATLPEVTFDALEQPLGHLSPEIQRPFVRLYEANACSLQYVIAARPGWSIIEAFRAFALAYPVALWVLRWCSHGREPTPADAIEMVTIIDRGQGHRALTGWNHRRRVATIAQSGELERMIVWYA